MKEQKEVAEWNILIALFKATVEQTNCLTGLPKQHAKMLFNRFTREGYRLLNEIEKTSNEEYLEELTGVIEDAVHTVRKKTNKDLVL